MRLIAPLIIALFGAGIGLLINRLFQQRGIAPVLAAIIGAVAAFAGLILRDVLDITFVQDPLFDSLLAALAAAFIVSLIAHIAVRFHSNKP